MLTSRLTRKRNTALAELQSAKTNLSHLLAQETDTRFAQGGHRDQTLQTAVRQARDQVQAAEDALHDVDRLISLDAHATRNREIAARRAANRTPTATPIAPLPSWTADARVGKARTDYGNAVDATQTADAALAAVETQIAEARTRRSRAHLETQRAAAATALAAAENSETNAQAHVTKIQRAVKAEYIAKYTPVYRAVAKTLAVHLKAAAGANADLQNVARELVELLPDSPPLPWTELDGQKLDGWLDRCREFGCAGV